MTGAMLSEGQAWQAQHSCKRHVQIFVADAAVSLASKECLEP